jgi:uncharacterized membrane protein
MELFKIVLALSTFLCSLVAGFLFAFAVVVMPGIRNLGDREFILTFQEIDRIIQNSQPIFILVWVGSAVLSIAALVIGFGQLEGPGLMLMILATVAYNFGVHLPTVIFNIPLNNKLQTLDVDEIGEDTLKFAREEFESPWNRWNLLRTVISSLVSILLITLLLMI